MSAQEVEIDLHTLILGTILDEVNEYRRISPPPDIATYADSYYLRTVIYYHPSIAHGMTERLKMYLGLDQPEGFIEGQLRRFRSFLAIRAGKDGTFDIRRFLNARHKYFPGILIHLAGKNNFVEITDSNRDVVTEFLNFFATSYRKLISLGLRPKSEKLGIGTIPGKIYQDFDINHLVDLVETPGNDEWYQMIESAFKPVIPELFSRNC
jgi:hypothetical protein